MSHRLRLVFEESEGFLEEYRRNMSAGGAFVHTDTELELREQIEVEIYLGFCSTTMVLEAEVVHQMPGAVAVQFLEDTGVLRERFEEAEEQLEAAAPPPAETAAPADASDAPVDVAAAPASGTTESGDPLQHEEVFGSADELSAPPFDARADEATPSDAPADVPTDTSFPFEADEDLELGSDEDIERALASDEPLPDSDASQGSAPPLEAEDTAPDVLRLPEQPVAALVHESEPEPEVRAEFTEPDYADEPFDLDAAARAAAPDLAEDSDDEDIDLQALARALAEDDPAWDEPPVQPSPLQADAEAQREPGSRLDELEHESLVSSRDRRQARRQRAAVPARLQTTDFHLDGHTRDLSETGVLISADASELPLGKEVRLRLQSPESGEHIEVAGRVSRHIEADGTVAAVGVEFEPGEGEAPHLRDFVQGVRRSIEERQERGISGVIEELGMPNLVQMLGASSPSGTLIASHGPEEGVIAFASGVLRYTRLGRLRGMKALSRMLAWTEGHFEFYATVDPLDDEDEPQSLEAALLDGVRQLDERERMAVGGALEMTSTFAVDRSAHAAEPEPSKIEEAVLDLAEADFTLRRIIDVIPEPDADIMEAVNALLDGDVLTRHCVARGGRACPSRSRRRRGRGGRG